MIIVKNLDGFSECDFVILFILASLLRIPFEYKHSDSWGNLTFAMSRAQQRRREPRCSRVGLDRTVRFRFN